MLKNYFKTAIRNLWRYKGFTLINVLSLTLGITGCLVIALFIWDENKYDTFLPDAENIYRIYEQRTDNNVTTYAAISSPAMGPFLVKEYPEVEVSARILMNNDKFLLEHDGQKNYENKGWIVEETFFKIFPLKFISGDPVTALIEPSTVVLTKELAQKYFGTEEVVGRVIKIDNSIFTIKGVLEKLPTHFHLDFKYLISLSTANLPTKRMENWTWHQFYTYIKLKPGANAGKLQEKFQGYVKKEVFPTFTQVGSTFLPFLQPLSDIHLGSADFIYDNAVRGNKTYVNALSIIAIFVLLIACFNFINLSTARSFRRAKEIGVRKVIGAERGQLVIQFISETVLLAVFSTLLAAVTTLFIIPALNEFTGKRIQYNLFTDPTLLSIIIITGILIGIVAGLYPAFILSGFQPIRVLKNMKLSDSSSSWLRQALVVIQFSLSVLLIISTIVVYRQTQFLEKNDLGFKKEQVVYFNLRDSLATNPQKLEAFKTVLRKSPNIRSVTSGYGLPGDAFAGDGIIIPTPEGQKEYAANVFIGDADYVKTLGLRILAGRDFSKEMITDLREAFIINETAVKEWGLGSPEKAIGTPIYWNEWEPEDTTAGLKKGKVIGVVQDFHYKSLHEKVAASVIQQYPIVAETVAAKIIPVDMGNTLNYINKTWEGFVSAYPLDIKFMDETYSLMYVNEQKLSSLLWIFTLVAIGIGCMGLFGLAAFSAEQRTKEIGIRKVLGANSLNIMKILSAKFVMLILISSFLSFPIAWWTMNNWLRDFPYRVKIDWWVFLLAATLAIIIALFTISFQVIKAAFSNPVKSLRTE